MELLERGPTLEQLKGLLSDAEGRQGRLAVIGGEAGIGKTVLIRHFCESVSDRADVFIGACDPLSTPTPLGPFFEIASAMGGEFEALLRERASVRLLGAALLGWRGVRPRVLVVEDMHWADDATLDMLRFLSRRQIGTRTLLIATYRDDEVGPRHPLRVALGQVANAAVVRVNLAGLSLDAVRRLLVGSDVDANDLHRRTGGNPFFINEILASPGATVPVTVRDAVLARLARLAPPARAALGAAAVSGPRVDPWLIEQVVAHALDGLDACVEAGLLVTERDVLMFRHELVREAILDTLPAHRQIVLHRQILAALVKMGVRDELLARLAHHAEGSANAAAVLEYAPAAARHASQLGAHRESAAQYARALRLANHLEPRQQAMLLESRGLECYLIDSAPEAIAARRAAVELWHTLGDREREGDNLRLLSRSYWLAGRNDAAERSASQALEVLESCTPSLALAGALSNYAQMQYLKCDCQAAIGAAERAMAMAATCDTPEATSISIHAALTRDAARWALGSDAGRRQLESTLRDCLAGGLEDHAARAYALLAGLSRERYDLDRAERYLQEGLMYAHEHDLQMYRHYLLSGQSLVLLLRGRWTEALQQAEAIVASAEHSVINRVIPLTVVGLVRGRRGEPVAWEPLDLALELASQIGEPQRVVPVHAARAEVAWLEGDLERCASEARPAFDLAMQTPYPWYAAEAALWLWRAGQLPPIHRELPPQFAHQIRGDFVGAAQVWQQLGCPYEQACALLSTSDVGGIRVALSLANKLGALPLAAMLVDRLYQLGTRPASPRPNAGTSGKRTRTQDHWSLSRRELEVASLVAQAYTNREIAERLRISERTAEKHVQNILNRLGMRSRTQAAAWAVQHAVGPASADS